MGWIAEPALIPSRRLLHRGDDHDRPAQLPVLSDRAGTPVAHGAQILL